MRRTLATVASALAAALFAASVPTAALAEDEHTPSLTEQVDTGSLEEGTLILQGPDSEPYVVPDLDDTGLLPPPSTGEEPIRVRSIQDTALNARCALPGTKNLAIDKYPSKSHGTISFQCGNSSYGYEHIKRNHPEPQWRAQMGSKGSWTAYMRYLQRSALNAPDKVKNQAGNKACYSTPVQVHKLLNGKPMYWKTINPSVVISKNNKRIVTSIPSTRGAC